MIHVSYHILLQLFIASHDMAIYLSHILWFSASC